MRHWKSTSRASAAIAAAVVCASGATARAQVAYEADTNRDGLILLGAAAGSLLFMAIPVTPDAWSGELLPWDHAVRDNASASAGKLADATLVVTVVTPLALQLGGPLDDAAGERALIYGQTLAVNLLLTQGAKYLVQRPRPYTYHPDHRVRAYAAASGDDSYLSFYSGHASTAFAAAVGGSYLFSLDSDDADARAVMWGTELALAAFTSGLRVRAGKHYYSDVALGALAGSAIGLLVPLAHRTDGAGYEPTAGEWITMGSGLVLGVAAAWLIPMPDDVLVKLERTAVVPAVMDGGAGVALVLVR